MKIKAVIIDDIELARASLMSDIEDYCPHVEIIGQADGVLSGLKLIKSVQPELVFLDIHMADGEGFDILELMKEKDFGVIFTTASEEHAIKAFRHNAIDYLLKPIDPELLKEAVDRFKNKSLPKKEKKIETIALSTLDDLKIVKIKDIVRCESDGNYTTVYEMSGEKTMVSKSLKEFEKKLSEHGFYRSHQSHLVSLDKVAAYLKSEGGFLKMQDGSEVPVSVRKKAEAQKILSKS
jgi:two-component system LytT family response regulator